MMTGVFCAVIREYNTTENSISVSESDPRAAHTYTDPRAALTYTPSTPSCNRSWNTREQKTEHTYILLFYFYTSKIVFPPEELTPHMLNEPLSSHTIETLITKNASKLRNLHLLGAVLLCFLGWQTIKHKPLLQVDFDSHLLSANRPWEI